MTQCSLHLPWHEYNNYMNINNHKQKILLKLQLNIYLIIYECYMSFIKSWPYWETCFQGDVCTGQKTLNEAIVNALFISSHYWWPYIQLVSDRAQHSYEWLLWHHQSWMEMNSASVCASWNILFSITTLLQYLCFLYFSPFLNWSILLCAMSDEKCIHVVFF